MGVLLSHNYFFELRKRWGGFRVLTHFFPISGGLEIV